MPIRPQSPRILIAGIGNIFLGDDAFGVEVAQRLLGRPMPEGVCVIDFGIRGLDLAFTLLDGYDAVILLDAMPRGGAPGTIYVLEPEWPAPAALPAVPMMEAHSMDPVRVLQTAAALGATVGRVIIVGCEPALRDDNNFAAEPSAPVRLAVDEAIAMIEALLAQLLGNETQTAATMQNGKGNLVLQQEITSWQTQKPIT